MTNLLSVSPGKRNSRSVNLLHLRQREHDLSPVSRHVVPLTRVALEIHCLEVGQAAEFLVKVGERLDLVVRGPELLEILQVGYVLDSRDLVVADVEGAELGLGFSSSDQ